MLSVIYFHTDAEKTWCSLLHAVIHSQWAQWTSRHCVQYIILLFSVLPFVLALYRKLVLLYSSCTIVYNSTFHDECMMKIKINHVLRKDTGCMCKYVLNIWQKNNLPANRYVLLDRTWKLTFFLSSEIFKSLTSRMVDEYVLVYCSFLVNAFSLAAGSKSIQCQLTQILGASLSKWIPCDILESNFGHSNIPIVFCGGR